MVWTQYLKPEGGVEMDEDVKVLFGTEIYLGRK
jgi:hypothetical protein